MTEEFNEGRLGVTLLDSDYQEFAVNDELLINKRNGRLFYKNVIGEVIDIFQRYASNVSEERLNDLEEIMHVLIKRVSENGPAKMVHFRYALVAEENEQKVFKIPLTIFDKETDLLILNINSSIPIEEAQYEIKDRNIILNKGLKASTKLMILIMKNVPQVQDNGLFNGNILEDGTVGYEKLTPELQKKVDNQLIPANSISFQHLNKELREMVSAGGSIDEIGIDDLSADLRKLIETKELIEGAVQEEHLSKAIKDKLDKQGLADGAVEETHLSKTVKDKLDKKELVEGAVDEIHLAKAVRDKLDKVIEVQDGTITEQKLHADVQKKLREIALEDGFLNMDHFSPEVKEYLESLSGAVAKIYFQMDIPTEPGTMWLKPAPMASPRQEVEDNG